MPDESDTTATCPPPVHNSHDDPYSGFPPYAELSTPEPPKRKTWKLKLALVGGAVFVVFAGTAVAVFLSVGSDTAIREVAAVVDPFAEARSACDAAGEVSRIADSGDTLILDGRAYGGGTTEIACILHRLDVSEAVIEQMSDTRALDGRQEGSWRGYEASWTYHPNNGLDVIVTKAR